MLAKSLWLAPLFCLALGQATPEEKAKKDLDLMQGTWDMHALEINGKEVAKQQLQNTTLIVKDDVYRTKVKNKELTGFRLKLDPSKDPKTVDMILKDADGTEKVYKGIYSIEKDLFKMCRGLDATQERPVQLATWPDTNYFVVTWKKQPK